MRTSPNVGQEILAQRRRAEGVDEWDGLCHCETCLYGKGGLNLYRLEAKALSEAPQGSQHWGAKEKYQ